jgi:hypothetical protein
LTNFVRWITICIRKTEPYEIVNKATHSTNSRDQLSIEFIADKVKVNGPRIDGGYILSFEVGEYMQQQVSELLRIKQNTTLKVSVIEE